MHYTSPGVPSIPDPIPLIAPRCYIRLKDVLLLDKLANRIDLLNSRSEKTSPRMETIEEKLGRATNYLHDIKVIELNK